MVAALVFRSATSAVFKTLVARSARSGPRSWELDLVGRCRHYDLAVLETSVDLCRVSGFDVLHFIDWSSLAFESHREVGPQTARLPGRVPFKLLQFQFQGVPLLRLKRILLVHI